MASLKAANCHGRGNVKGHGGKFVFGREEYVPANRSTVFGLPPNLNKAALNAMMP